MPLSLFWSERGSITFRRANAEIFPSAPPFLILDSSILKVCFLKPGQRSKSQCFYLSSRGSHFFATSEARKNRSSGLKSELGDFTKHFSKQLSLYAYLVVAASPHSRTVDFFLPFFRAINSLDEIGISFRKRCEKRKKESFSKKSVSFPLLCLWAEIYIAKIASLQTPIANKLKQFEFFSWTAIKIYMPKHCGTEEGTRGRLNLRRDAIS